MTTTRVTWGAISLRTSRDLPYIENSPVVNPVMLPPGCARLETKPLPTGSVICTKTIGMLRVSCCSGCNTSGLLARITSGRGALQAQVADGAPPGARSGLLSRVICFVPASGHQGGRGLVSASCQDRLMHWSKQHPYSMTSFARASSFVGSSGPSALKVRKSIDLDVRSIHDSCPFLCLCSDEGGEVLGRAHLGFSAELGEDRFHLLGSHKRGNLSVEPVNNKSRSSGGCEHG